MDHKLAAEAARESNVELADFVRVVDEAVAFSNWGANELKSPKAANLAALYGMARYTAFVGRSKTPEDRETYVRQMSDRFADMMRAHFEDPTLK
ncbi:MAG: DUF3144 domain-containing protein [Bauldia sp.]